MNLYWFCLINLCVYLTRKVPPRQRLLRNSWLIKFVHVQLFVCLFLCLCVCVCFFSSSLNVGLIWLHAYLECVDVCCAHDISWLLDFLRKKLCRPESEEEKILKEEIDNLKKELEKESPTTRESEEEPAADQPSLQDKMLQKERELEKLSRDLNDKVRFGQKAAERPGSGAGRGGGHHERTPSQSGSFDDSRSVEFSERPRSRGTGELWTRPAEDRRGFQGGRERGFLGSRDLDRWALIQLYSFLPFSSYFHSF